MLREWTKNKAAIENSAKKTRKKRFHNVVCQEPELKAQLKTLFVETRSVGRKITNRWFARHARYIYEQLYFFEIIQHFERFAEYFNFKFFNGWFREFKRRQGISMRMSIKKAQTFCFFLYDIFSEIKTLILQQNSENFWTRIVNWLQFNRRNSQSLPDQTPLHEGGRYRLCDIENMNQIFIVYEFLQDHCYDFKEAKTMWLKIHRSGWNYRQATLMLYVFVDEMLRCKPFLIFKGKDGLKNNIIKKKMIKYDHDVVVQWNKKVYCNAQIMINWLQNQYKYAIVGFHNSHTKRFLSLNVFFGQKISEVKISFWKIIFDC